MADDLHVNHGQVRLVIQSMKSKIASKIVQLCSSIPSVEYVSFDKIRLLSADFKDFEIPAIQLIDVGMRNEHEQLRAKIFWQIALELLLKGNQYNEISQQDLWNLEYEVRRKLWAVPNLGIKGVISMNFLGGTTDLHLLEPYYFSRLDFEVQFYEDLVRAC